MNPAWLYIRASGHARMKEVLYESVCFYIYPDNKLPCIPFKK